MDKHHVAVFLLLDIAVIIAAARVGGAIARKLRQPAVVGEIAAGIALGPSLLGLLPGDIPGHLFPADVRPLLWGLAQIGLVLFMFIVGLELDMRLTKGRERAAASISITSIVFPFALGMGLAVVLYPRHDMVGGEQIGLFGLALFLGVAMSITAFPVLARILADRGMVRTVPGVFSLASAAIDDIIAWTLLAFIIAIIGGGEPLEVAKIVGLTLVYAVVMFGAVKPLLARLVAWRDKTGRMTPDILAVILIGLFLSAAATEYIGIHYIIGAFVFGAVMPKVSAEQLHREILERLEQVSVLLLLPMFFVYTGLTVDLAGIGLSGLWELGLILLVAIGGKFAGAYLGARVSAIPTRQSAAIAVLMNTRGLTEVVILTTGLQLGVLSDELFAMMVVMALVTTVLTEPLLRLVYPASVVAKDIAAAERRALAAATAPRVMVVLRDPDGSVEDLRRSHRRLLACAAGYDVVLAGVLTAPERTTDRLEVGAPVVPDFSAYASTVEKLRTLGGSLPGVSADAVLCRFSADPSRDLDEMAMNANADFVLIDAGDRDVGSAMTAAPVAMVDETVGADDLGAPGAVVCLADDSRDGRTAVLFAAGMALFGACPLVVVTDMSRRRLAADLGAISGRGVRVDVVDAKRRPRADDAFVVAAAAGTSSSEAVVLVADNTGTSEESLGDRVGMIFGQPHDTDATAPSEDGPGQPSNTTTQTERH